MWAFTNALMLLSNVFSVSEGNKHPGSSPLSRCSLMHLQHIPLLGQPGYVHVQSLRFVSFWHSIFYL